MKLEFCKYEGTGNDFILIDGRESVNPPKSEGLGIELARYPGINLPNETVAALCDRHKGIGADGLMILQSDPDGYDFRMKYHNSDGSIASMCGNGGRCIALFARHLGVTGSEMIFSGRDGLHRARILEQEERSAVVELGMVDVEGYEYSDKAFVMNTGVEHYVGFTQELSAVDVVERGREIRNSERFKPHGGTNVNFAEVAGPGHIRIRTYELGVEDETLACGTGAVASAIATHLNSQPDRFDFTVEVPGGRLDVSFKKQETGAKFTDILLTGAARRVFRGVIDTGNLFPGNAPNI